MKIRIRKNHLWVIGQDPHLELIADKGNYITKVLTLERENEMNMKLAKKIKKCLEKNIKLIKTYD